MSRKINGNVHVIAEVKTHNPFGQQLTANSWERQLDLAILTGTMISIHTHPLWRGSFELVAKAREKTNGTIVAKGFHGTDEEVQMALDAGADYVLVVGRLPADKYLGRCLIEPLTIEELRDVPRQCRMAVWNSRDLSSLKGLPGIPAFLEERWSKMHAASSDRKRESFQQARAAFKGELCQASNLRIAEDVEDGANAVLVGTNLASFAESMGVCL